MIADIGKLLEQQPFAPFTIHLADGRALPVPTLDHIYLFPNRATLIVHKDNGDYDLISGAQVTSASLEAGDNGR